MLFNSHEFLLVFLPLVLFGFQLCGKLGGGKVAVAWLVFMSLAFYGWWNPVYLWLLGASIIVNYFLGRLQAQACERSGSKGSKLQLTVGVVLNLALIGWYKYANFTVDSINYIAGDELFHLHTIILPLAISFFTFQQIAYLVDSYYGSTKNYGFLDYTLFVSFFPQLIAGPIVHHNEMLPQFAKHDFRLKADHVAIGLTIVAIGLFKKVVIADTIAQSASPVFRAAENGDPLTFFEAWGGVLAYTGQLYFDFSGYSDMAIGLARMFGITLPANFNSPLKARSIIDFWTRWHLTLSRFLRDYLFFPLCGKRPGPVRRQTALFATMVLGGLWHGAGWTFVLWGVCHGVYLMINHGWRHLGGKLGWSEPKGALSFSYGVLWFLALVVSLVFFRAESMYGVGVMFEGMVGANGVSLPSSFQGALGFLQPVGVLFPEQGTGAFPTKGFTHVTLVLLIAFLLPNSQEVMRNAKPVLGRVKAPTRLAWIQWQMNWKWAVFSLILLLASFALLTRVSEFLYFQF